jgi:ankyrin repeat protein
MPSSPVETINDWLLASRARYTEAYDEVVYEEHKSSRGFTKLHELLFKPNSGDSLMAGYLGSLTPEELKKAIDMPDARGRTPLAWAVEYGLTTSTKVLLRFGAKANQLRLTKDGGFSPLIHLAIAGPRSAWMDVNIFETVQLLLQAGAEINGADHEGWTPLHIAASWSLFDVTNLLQEWGHHFLNWQARTITGESILDVCDNMDYRNTYCVLVG